MKFIFNISFASNRENSNSFRPHFRSIQHTNSKKRAIHSPFVWDS
jgi:hypothetical protein